MRTRQPATAMIIIVITTSLLLLSHQAHAQGFGSQCGPTTHCATGSTTGSSGLICHQQRCTCANGTLTDSLRYTMTWDASRAQCVGLLDSVCIGTGRLPPPQGSKAVRCATPLTCVQLNGMGLGQGQCKDIPVTGGRGVECGPDMHCDSQAGLICHETEKKCVCGGGRLTDAYHFTMEWDDERASCVAIPGSACVGTRSDPSPGALTNNGVKRVECWRGDCLQLASMPPGIGLCQRTGEEEDDETTTSRGGGGDETTTSGGGGGGDDETTTNEGESPAVTDGVSGILGGGSLGMLVTVGILVIAAATT